LAILIGRGLREYTAFCCLLGLTTSKEELPHSPCARSSTIQFIPAHFMYSEFVGNCQAFIDIALFVLRSTKLCET
jgi:hypothetical protein